MTKVSSKEYQQVIIDFCKRNNLLVINTSEFVNNEYHKTYVCERGTLHEVNRIVYVPVEVYGVKTFVKLYEHEQWNTDDSHSIYLYEEC